MRWDCCLMENITWKHVLSERLTLGAIPCELFQDFYHLIQTSFKATSIYCSMLQYDRKNTFKKFLAVKLQISLEQISLNSGSTRKSSLMLKEKSGFSQPTVQYNRGTKLYHCLSMEWSPQMYSFCTINVQKSFTKQAVFLSISTFLRTKKIILPPQWQGRVEISTPFNIV